MSKNLGVPTNHHYVSQCHLREFFDVEHGKIYIYDKKLINFYSKSGTKRIFSLDNLNTRQKVNSVDKTSMELELQVMFEDNFSKHLEWIKKFVEDQSIIEKAYEHLNFIALMALVGEYRNPNYKNGLDNSLDMFKSHFEMLGLVINEELHHPDILYKNLKGYIEVAGLLLKEMDPITFSIVVIESNDHFILPDTTSFLVRESLEFGKVMQFGIPVSNKIFVLGKSTKLGSQRTRIIKISKDDNELVFKINSDIVNYAYKTVACKNEFFFKKTIEKIRQIGFKGQYFHGYTI